MTKLERATRDKEDHHDKGYCGFPVPSPSRIPPVRVSHSAREPMGVESIASYLLLEELAEDLSWTATEIKLTSARVRA